MKRSHYGVLGAVAIGSLAFGLTAGASPAAADDFYKGKTLTFFVGAGAGGNFGNYARTFAPHFARNIPGSPSAVVQYMPGGGGRKLAAHMHNVAPKDGTAVAMTIHSVPFWQRVKPRGKFDVSQWHWLGRIAALNTVLAVKSDAPAASLDAAVGKASILGATGKAGSSYQEPHLTNQLLGTKFKIVPGYKDIGEIGKAMEGNEVHGYTVNYLSWTIRRADWIKEGKVKFLVQYGLSRDPGLPNVPLLQELAKDQQSKDIAKFVAAANSIARSVFAPPGVPAERVAVLRAAFMKTVKDPAFLAETRKRKLVVIPLSGEKVAEIVNGLLKAPPATVDAYKKIVN